MANFIYMLPAEILNMILYHAFIGPEGPDIDTLDNCRKVCREWNVMIKRSVWQKPNKEWGIITKKMIEKNWIHVFTLSFPSDKMISHAKELEMKGVLSGVMDSLTEKVQDKLYLHNSKPVITCAASLAHNGYIGSRRHFRWLENVNLTSVPAEHLASFVSCVTRGFNIKGVSGCDIVNIIDSVKSEELHIYNQSLDSEETRALVRAMESRVKEVMLFDVTLDIGALMEYSGQGKCLWLVCAQDTAARYSDQLRTWATSRNWKEPNPAYYDFVVEVLACIECQSLQLCKYGIPPINH